MKKPLEIRFQEIQKTNPYWSSYLCFAAALRKGEKNIRQEFNRLVDKEDYVDNERKDILSHLFTISKK
jgi:hypothetical protein